MKKFLELGNRFAQNSDWTDFALTKFCLCAMGVIIGALLPGKYKKTGIAIAGGIFAATYIPLMAKVFKTAKSMHSEKA